jgi:hypothetical protein
VDNSPVYEVNIMELKTLINCLQITHGVPRPLLEFLYDTLLAKLVNAELLDSNAFKDMLSLRQHTNLVNRRKK